MELFFATQFTLADMMMAFVLFACQGLLGYQAAEAAYHSSGYRSKTATTLLAVAVTLAVWVWLMGFAFELVVVVSFAAFTLGIIVGYFLTKWDDNNNEGRQF